MNTSRIRSILLASFVTIGTLSAVACSNSPDNTDTIQNNNTTDTIFIESTEPHPYEEYDFEQQEFRILVSGTGYDGQQASIYTIVHDEETTGDIVREAVYKRNLSVEELLNVKLVFTESSDSYNDITNTLTNMISAGDDAYELVIHDLFPLAAMSVNNYFANVLDIEHLDFSQPYWYEDFMKDISFQSKEKRYLLAGDYFLDILRSSHALYVNKDMFTNLYDSTDVLYEHVLNGTWTQECFLTYIADTYQDLNGDGTQDASDRYGYCYPSMWGPMIPWVVSSDITYLDYSEDGTPMFAMNNERSVLLLERLNTIFHHQSSYNHGQNSSESTTAFINGNALFAGYHRVSSLELFRDMEIDIGILPYPKMDEGQDDYITSVHDTTNVGIIPNTCTKSDMLGVVLEVLSMETEKTVIPAYYETALKVKYARDDQSSQMLDIIRYHIDDVFPVAFNGYCSSVPLEKAFCIPLQKKSTDFVSNYKRNEKYAQSKLDDLWEAFSSED
ncbi:MAG: hypothetical protein IJW77_03860 [Clostridia bacterium]|nr:hypothetical protein [Clostridia bacterium]